MRLRNCWQVSDDRRAGAHRRAVPGQAWVEGVMADIKQAAMWMQEGKSVARRNPKLGIPSPWKQIPVEPASAFKANRHGLVVGCEPRVVPGFSIEGLLADDWEIAE